MKKLATLIAVAGLALAACGGSDVKEDAPPTEERQIEEATSGGMERGFEEEAAVEEAPADGALAEEPEAAAPAEAPE